MIQPIKREQSMGTDISAKSSERDIREELTESELSSVTGGKGSGAGKVTFNPFSITKHYDKASPTLFQA